MAKLVIGNNKTVGVPVVTKEVQVAPNYWISRKVVNGTYQTGDQTEFSFNGATSINNYALNSAFSNGSIQRILGLDGIKEVGLSGLESAFQNCSSLSGSLDFSNIETVYGNAFVYCFSGTHLSGNVNFAKLNGVSNGAFQYAFFTTDITSFSCPAVVNITNNAFNSCCRGCIYLTTFDFSNLNYISSTGLQNMFYGCTSLTTASFPKLTTIDNTGMYSCFAGCSSLTTVSMPNLTTFSGTSNTANTMNGCFEGCSSLTSVYMPRLKIMRCGTVFANCFQNCTSLTSLSFPSLTTDSFGTKNSQFNNMLSGVTGCTVHFPSNIQATIGSWSSVTGGFGGTNTTVLFDLPATVTLTGANSVDYQRNPNYDTGTALAWYNETDGYEVPFYTSGTSDPTTGATIYSDSSCTTAVTTISSIA